MSPCLFEELNFPDCYIIVKSEAHFREIALHGRLGGRLDYVKDYMLQHGNTRSQDLNLIFLGCLFPPGNTFPVPLLDLIVEDWTGCGRVRHIHRVNWHVCYLLSFTSLVLNDCPDK